MVPHSTKSYLPLRRALVLCQFGLGCARLLPPFRSSPCRPAGSFSAVIVVLVFLAFSAYNRLVALGQRVGQAFADIDVQLKQRHDLIPNLVETVKGYASHERGTLDDVIKARNSAMSAQGPAQVSAAENQLSGALGRLIALSEAYPDLKANANFQQLASELSDLENKIAASRRFFNNAVQEYNTGIQQMPAALFAGMFGFTKKDFFDLGASRTEVEATPQVKF
ncbi:LemA protein [Bradyrhizobium sp. S3.14.4]